MSAKYIKTYTVSWGDLDVNYRLTNISAIKYFQETFALYCAANNVAAFDICSKNLVWVISDLRVNFFGAMPFWSENFSVEIWISEKSKMKTYCDFKIYFKNSIIAEGDSCWYLLDMQTRRPVKSDEILNCLKVFNEKIFEQREKQIFLSEKEKICEKKHEVTVHDLDFNYHVNNLAYIRMLEETIPSNFAKEYDLFSYNTRFVKESYLGDNLICEVFKKNNNTLSSRIYRKSDNADICYLTVCYRKKIKYGRNPREAGVLF
ncbi:MAG: acyl-[acyl-carrier-protein] thioesterase [Candidatus Gastranaerophilaceae bacterium]